MAEEIKKVIDIQVKGAETVRSLTTSIKELTEALSNCNKESEQFKTLFGELATSQAKLSKAMNAGKKDTESVAGSYNALRKEMSTLKKEWASLGAGAERDNIGKKINGINTQLKGLDAQLGNHQRNVGNYKEAFVGAFNTMGGSVKGMIPPVNTLDKSLKGLAKNPAMLVFAALAAVIVGLVKGFKSSEENMNKLTTAFSGFKAVGDAVTKVLQAVAGWLGDLANKVTNLLDKWGLLGEKFKERQRLAQEEIKLIKKERDMIVQRAEVETEAAELREKASDAEKYSYQERISFLEQAKAKETENLNLEKEILAAKIAQYEATINLTQSTGEELTKLNEMKAELVRLNGRIADTGRQYNKQINNLRKQAVASKKEETQTILNLQKQLLEQEYNLEKQGSEKQLELSKEIRKKDYEIEMAGIEAKFKNKRMREQAEKLALQKYHADIEKLEREHQENLFQISLQKQNDIYDTQIALETENLEKLKKQREKAVKEYEAIQKRGVESGQTQENFKLELAQILESIRGFDEAIIKERSKIDEKLREELVFVEKAFSTSNYDYYYKYYQTLLDRAKAEYDAFKKLRSEDLITEQLPDETDKDYNARKLKAEQEYQKALLDVRKQYANIYLEWYDNTWDKQFEKIKAQDKFDELLSYAQNIPHNIFDYVLGTNPDSMRNREADFELLKRQTEMYFQNITKLAEELWKDEEGDKPFDLSEALFLLPEDVQNEYLQRLADLRDAEGEILQQRYDNWMALGTGIGDLFGNIADLYEQDIKRRQKNGKINQKQAEKEFENVKALQIAQAVINTLAGSVGAFLQASQTYPAPYGQIIGGVAAAAATTAGIAQIAKIQNTEYGGGSSASVSTPTPTAAVPIVDSYEPAYTKNLTSASDVETLNAGLEKANLWVSVTDIDNTQERGRTRVAESSF